MSEPSVELERIVAHLTSTELGAALWGQAVAKAQAEQLRERIAELTRDDTADGGL